MARDDELEDLREEVRAVRKDSTEMRKDIRELRQALLTERGTARPTRLGLVGWATAWSLTVGPIIGAYLATR